LSSVIRARRGRSTALKTRPGVDRAHEHKQLDVTVQIATQRRGVPHPRTFARWANAAFAASGISLPQQAKLTLTIRIVGAAESRRLNRTWRGKDKPTNVLSFPSLDLGAPSDGSSKRAASLARACRMHSASQLGDPHLGDLAVCAVVVRREAREQGKGLNAHWAHMIVHGVLHLLGYDHENERDAGRMEGLEVRILARLGIDNPYIDAWAA
jgi:probable rRNA maturation factor